MELRPFLLDQWLARFADVDLPYNLAGSTGPAWRIDELLRLEPGSEDRLRALTIAYQPSAGRRSLRGALADMTGVPSEQFVVTCGAAEALFHLFMLAARPGRNVVVPSPGFPPYHAVPEALGLEVRTYGFTGGQFDIEQITSATDAHTQLILVNTPHNPTGAVLDDEQLGQLHAFAASRGVQLVVDEVFHPIYHGPPAGSAHRLPGVTVISDLSKAFALPGLRIGWLREPDPQRREHYINAREYLSVSNSAAGELLGEIAVRNRHVIHGRTQEAAGANLALLDSFLAINGPALDWVRPGGGTTAFIRFKHTPNTRPFCEHAASEGLLLVPGDCFGCADHVRLGLGAAHDVFARALAHLSAIMSAVPAR